MLELYLFRHPESEMNLQEPNLIYGPEDNSVLTILGKQQLEKLEERLDREKITFHHLSTSPALRCQALTQRIALAANCSHPIIITPNLRDRNEGEWIGKKRSEIYTPDLIKRCQSDDLYHWNLKAPGGESYANVAARVLEWIEAELLANSKYQQGVAAVCSHRFAIRCLLKNILQFPTASLRKIEIGYTSITKLTYTRRNWSVNQINDTSHLVSLPRS